MSELENFDRLKFYREELKYEYTLLSNRLGLFVTSQSFLVSAFAVLSASMRYPATVWILGSVALLGITISLLIRIPIKLSHISLQKWLALERKLLMADSNLSESVFGERDAPCSYDDAEAGQSMHFSGAAPIVFIVLWAILIVGTIFRVATGHYAMKQF